MNIKKQMLWSLYLRLSFWSLVFKN